MWGSLGSLERCAIKTVTTINDLHISTIDNFLTDAIIMVSRRHSSLSSTKNLSTIVSTLGRGNRQHVCKCMLLFGSRFQYKVSV